MTPNILHILQAANPDMDMSQILNMMQMAWEEPDAPIPHAHRGGPRPATADPFAPGNLAAAAILAHGHLLDTAGPAHGNAPPDAPSAADGEAPAAAAAQPSEDTGAPATPPHPAVEPASGGLQVYTVAHTLTHTTHTLSPTPCTVL